MSAVYQLIESAFGLSSLQFATHGADEERAFTYLAAARHAHILWPDAEQDIRSFLGNKGCSPTKIDEEVERARPFLAPWLA